MATVYFVSARAKKWKYEDSLAGKLEAALNRVGLSTFFNKNEWVAIKTHFGSEGAHRIVRPVFLKKVVDALKGVGARPFITDSVRAMGLDYLEIANQNGLNAFLELIKAHGKETVQTYLELLRQHASLKMTETLKNFPNGNYSATELLDDGYQISKKAVQQCCGSTFPCY